MKNVLKVWLSKNALTADPNDHTASVSSVGSVDLNDIITEMVAEGTEYKPETLRDIVTRFQRVTSRLALNGYNVNTGQVYMKSVVTGVFYNNKWDNEKNSVYVSITQGVDLRKAVAETSVEILGEKADLMTIYQIINMVNKTADGTLIKGRNALIEGSYIKITGENPAVGIYFVNTLTQTETKLVDEDIIINDPSKVMILVPQTLEAGNYCVKIISQYSSNKSMKKLRELTFEQEIAIS